MRSKETWYVSQSSKPGHNLPKMVVCYSTMLLHGKMQSPFYFTELWMGSVLTARSHPLSPQRSHQPSVAVILNFTISLVTHLTEEL